MNEINNTNGDLFGSYTLQYMFVVMFCRHLLPPEPYSVTLQLETSGSEMSEQTYLSCMV